MTTIPKAKDIVTGTTFYTWFGKITKLNGRGDWLFHVFELVSHTDINGPRKELHGTVNSYKEAMRILRLSDPAWPRNQRGKVTRYGWVLSSLPCDVGKRPTCPRCFHVGDVEHMTLPYGAGTGPMGRYRLGDNYRPAVRCTVCGYMHAGQVHIVQPFNNPPSIEL